MIWLVVSLRLRNVPCSLSVAYEEEKSGVTEQETASKTGTWQLPPDGQRDRVTSWDVGSSVGGG